MISAAAGMATCGLTPVASTFAFLMTLRAGEPIRSLIAYNRLNVKLAGGYAGFSDFADGASHQSIADLAIMRAMPAMTVLVPSDIETTRGAIRAMVQHKGPVYLRLSREQVGSHHGGDESFTIGKANVLRDGTDITIAVCGTLLSEALSAAAELAKENIQAAVVEFTTLKPFDQETLVQFAAKTGVVVSVEEHNVIGGLGGAVAETLSNLCPVPLRQIGIADTFGESGPYAALLAKYGLTAASIIRVCREMLQKH